MALILKRVGRYEVLKEIGRGGMATVYLARQTDLDRHVALKELATLHSSDEAFAERFLRESRMAGSLSHPNIVTVHDYFEHEGTPYISMEYIERGSLRTFIDKLTFAQVGGVLEGLLAGLQHAGSRGIVHRDMKPENVMVTGEGGVKISDFGIGRALNQANASKFLTATGTAIGTPAYMAPEQAMAKEVGPWTDLYSLGIMAYEMVLGQVPFSDSDTPMSMLVRHVSEAIPAPATVDSSIDPALSDWMEWLLQKDPAARPADAQKAWDRLEEIVIHLLGPRWRREARLLDSGAPADADEAKPLTPAPFSEEREKVTTPEPVYVTYVPEEEEDGVSVPAAAAAAGAAAAAAASLAAEAVATPPASEAVATPPAVEVVATPPAAEAVATPPAAEAVAAPVEAPAPAAEEPAAAPAEEVGASPVDEAAAPPAEEAAAPAAAEEPASGGLDLDLAEEDMYLTFAPGSKAKAVAPPAEEAAPPPPPPEPEPAPVVPEPVAAEPEPAPVAAEPQAPPAALEPAPPEPEPAPVAVEAAPEPQPEPEPAPVAEPEPAVAAAATAAAAAVAAEAVTDAEPEAEAEAPKEKRGFGKLKRPKIPKIPVIPGVPSELQQFAPGVAEEVANVNAEAQAAPMALRAPSAANAFAEVAPGAAMDVANVESVGAAAGAPSPSIPRPQHKQEDQAPGDANTGAAVAAAAAATGAAAAAAPEASAAAPPAAPPEPPAAAPPPPDPAPPQGLDQLPSDLRVTVPPDRAPKAVEPEPAPEPEAAPVPVAEQASFVLTDAVAKIEGKTKEPKAPKLPKAPKIEKPKLETPKLETPKIEKPPIEKLPKEPKAPKAAKAPKAPKVPKQPGTGVKIKPAYLIGGVAGIAAIAIAAVLLSGGSSKKNVNPPTTQSTQITTTTQTTTATGPTGATKPTGPVGPLVTAPDTQAAALDRAALSAFGGSLYVASPGGSIQKLDAGTLAAQSSATDPGGPNSAVEAYGRLFLADGKTLTSLNLKSLGPIASVELPGGIALAGGQDRHLVSLQKQGSTGQICVVTPKALSPCATTPFVPAGALVSKGGIIYVVNGASGQVVPYTIGASSLSAGSPMTAGKGATGTPVELGGKLYVPVKGGIAVINLANGALEQTINLGVTPSALVAPPVGKKLFAALYPANKLVVIDTTKPSATPAVVPGGQGPVALVPTAKGLAVIDAGSHSVALVNPVTGALSGKVAHLPTLGTKVAAIHVGSPQISSTGQTVTVKLPFTSGSLDPSGFLAKSARIAKGKAVFDLWQGGITSSGGKTGQGVTVRSAPLPGRLTVTLAAASGAFTKLSSKLGPGGRSVVFTLTKKPPPVVTTPVQTTPVQTTPVQTTPVQTTPVQTTPVQTTPVQTTPAQTTPTQTTTPSGGGGGGGGGIPGITVG